MGMEELSIALNSPASLVQAWIQGQASMPDRKLLLLADILDKHANRK
jgi:hypothetical protein